MSLLRRRKIKRNIRPEQRYSFSYERAVDNRQKKPKKIKLKFKYIFGLIVILSLFIIAAKSFCLIGISILGNKYLNSTEVVGKIRQQARYFILPANLLWLNTNKIQTSIKKDYPIIDRLDIKRVWPHNLVISVQEVLPSLYWSSENKIYWLNQDGVVIANAKPISNRVEPFLVVDKANVPVSLGNKIVTNQFINFVTEAKKGIEQQVGLKVLEIDIKESTYEPFFIADKGYYIRLNTQRDLKSQLNDLRAVLNKLTSLAQKPVEYIDLRIEGRVFYK